jgi:hypothetical protein
MSLFYQSTSTLFMFDAKSRSEDLTNADKEELMNNGVWNTNSPVSMERLKKLTVAYIDFNGAYKKGELVVFDVVAPYVLAIFKELFEQNFPIDKIVPMQNYHGSDERSMMDNNSSAFNCRQILNTDRWSSHAYGMAIDINPVQNPYLIVNYESSKIEVYPNLAIEFVNRNLYHPGMVENVVSIFRKYGFSVWGGVWKTPIDYHHFQIDWEHINKLVTLDTKEGANYFKNKVL